MIYFNCFALYFSLKTMKCAYFKNLFIYLFHTPICHQSRVGLCGKLTNTIPNKKKGKTLESPRNSKMKNSTNCLILLNINLTFIHLRFDNVASAIENLNKIEFEWKKYWPQIRFYKLLNQSFFLLKLNISFSYIFFSFPTADQISDASNINTQFIITCFDVCSSTPHGQFEWSNFDILRSCKNFISLNKFHKIFLKILFSVDSIKTNYENVLQNGMKTFKKKIPSESTLFYTAFSIQSKISWVKT